MLTVKVVVEVYVVRNGCGVRTLSRRSLLCRRVVSGLCVASRLVIWWVRLGLSLWEMQTCVSLLSLVLVRLVSVCCLTLTLVWLALVRESIEMHLLVVTDSLLVMSVVEFASISALVLVLVVVMLISTESAETRLLPVLSMVVCN